MAAILKKELKVYMTSIWTYVYGALYFLVTGLFFVKNCLKTADTTFGYYVLNRSFLVVILFIPICTMFLFAKEKKEHTDQLLFTAPVSLWKIVTAKYIAALFIILSPLLLSVIYPLVMSSYGTVSVPFTAAAYIACLLTVLFLLAIGTCISSMVPNPVAAMLVSYIVYGLIVLLHVVFNSIEEGMMRDGLLKMSVYAKYNDMISGIVRSGDVIYILLLSVAFLLAACIFAKGRHSHTVFLAGVKICILLAAAFGMSVIAMYHTKVYDFTAEQLLTLSDETKQVLKHIENPTYIYYMGKKGRANATYQELLSEYRGLNSNIEIIYKDVEADSAFYDEYLSDIENIHETSMLVVSKDKQIYLDAADFTSNIYESSYSIKNYLDIENQLTSAIYYVNADQSEKVVFVEGNGEKALSDRFTKLLKMNNYDIDTSDIEEAAHSIEKVFAKDSKAAIIHAPQADYSENAINTLKDYLEKGGNLFIILDPLNEGLNNLYQFLEEYGLSVQSGVVIEQEQGGYVYDTPYYLAPDIKDSIYTAEIRKRNMQLFTMTSKGIKAVGTKNGYQVTEVLKTSTQAFSKVGDFDNITGKGEEDIQGPFLIAAAAQKEGEGSLFVIASDLFLQSDVDMEANGENRKFFLDVVNILTEHEDGIMIEGKEINNQKAFYPTQSRTFVTCLVTGVIPVIIIGLGALVLFIRYRTVRLRLKKGGEKHVQEG